MTGLLPGGRVVQSLAGAGTDVFLTWQDAQRDACEEYPFEQMVQDFAKSFVVEMIGSYVGDFASKYGVQAIEKGLKQLGVDEATIKKLTKALDDGDGSDGSDGSDSGVSPPCAFNSFSALTVVLTDEGFQAISTLQLGDTVLAWNEATGQLEWQPITALISHQDTVVQYLTLSGEVIIITTTSNHPFYTVERGWVVAGQLRLGEQVLQADGSTGIVEASAFVVEPQRMYNLTVDTAHTFFVGAGRWVVHNAGCTRKLSPNELGIKGNLADFDATFTLVDTKATIRVDMIEGQIENPLEVLQNAQDLAKSNGAEVLRIEATVVNDRLYNILTRRYNFVTEGSNEFIEILLK